MNLSEWTHAHTRTVIGAVALVALIGWLYVHEARNKGEDLANLRTFIAQHDADNAKATAQAQADLAAANARIEALEKQKQIVVTQPAMAPQIIHEYLPTSTPIQQTAPITKETAPDAPVAVLTRQNEQDLAAFALTCRECTTELPALKADNEAKAATIKTLTAERNKAVETANGGSVWHRVWTVTKYAGCGGLGAGAGSQVKKPGSAAIGAALGVFVCALEGKGK